MANFHNRLKIAIEEATKGDVDAQFLIGTTLCFGALMPKDEKTGLKWLQKAAIAKHPKACLALGLFHYKQNLTLSLSWLRQASDLEDPDAPYFLWKQDIAKTKLWDLAIKRGSPLALYEKALILKSPLSLNQNKQRLVNCVEQNNAIALYILSFTEENKELQKEMKRTAARAGVIEALLEMASIDSAGKEKWLRSAYEAGSTTAGFQLARHIIENHQDREPIEESLLILKRLDSHVEKTQKAECLYLKGRAYSLRYLKTESQADKMSAIRNTYDSHLLGSQLGTDLLKRVEPDLIKFGHEESVYKGLRSKRFIMAYSLILLISVCRIAFLIIQMIDKNEAPSFSMLEMILYPGLAFIAFLAMGSKRPALLDELSPSLKTLLKRANNGDKYACFHLGQKYIEGDGIDIDLVKGMTFLKAAASSGLAVAQYKYGQFLEKHRTDKRSETLEWWEKASNSNNKDAQYQLAEIYIHDSKKTSQAIDLLKRAHRQGCVKATRWLGWIYLNGKYRKANPTKAIKYLGISLAHTDTNRSDLEYGIACAWMMTEDQTGRTTHRLWQAAISGHGGALVQLYKHLDKSTHINTNFRSSSIRPWGQLAEMYVGLFDQLHSLSTPSLSQLASEAGVDLIMQAGPNEDVRKALEQIADIAFIDTMDKVIPYGVESHPNMSEMYKRLSSKQLNARLRTIGFVYQMYQNKTLSFKTEPPNFIQTMILSRYKIYDLRHLSEREMQILLQRCDINVIHALFTGGNARLKAHIFKNLSPRIIADIRKRNTEHLLSLADISIAFQELILTAEALHRQRLIMLNGVNPLPQPGPLLKSLICDVLSSVLNRCDASFLQRIIRESGKKISITSIRYAIAETDINENTVSNMLNKDNLDEYEMQTIENSPMTARDALDWLISLESMQMRPNQHNQTKLVPSFSISTTAAGAVCKAQIRLATASFTSLLKLPADSMAVITNALNYTDALNLLSAIPSKSIKEAWLSHFPPTVQVRLKDDLLEYGTPPNLIADEMNLQIVEHVLEAIDNHLIPLHMLEQL